MRGWLTPLFDVPARQIREPLKVDRQVFTRDGAAVHTLSFSAFPLWRRFADGTDIRPLLHTFKRWGYNQVRVWPYVKWVPGGWVAPALATAPAFIELCRREGFDVEFTLLTDDDSREIEPAIAMVEYLTPYGFPNLLFEIGNEPVENGKRIDCAALVPALTASPYLWASGLNDNTAGVTPVLGDFITHHDGRTPEWVRYGHDSIESWRGEGPTTPHPPWHIPLRFDEPQRPDQVGYAAVDFYQHALTCAQMGAGVTFHYEGGKQATMPTDLEAVCAQQTAIGTYAIPPEVPLGEPSYRRIDEQGGTLRTYVVGAWMTRLRPLTPNAPEPGWLPMDNIHVLWRRA